MTITDNWRGLQAGIPGGDRVGLGEVAFEITGAIGNRFEITDITLSGGNVSLTFRSTPGAKYGIFRSTDLTPDWEELDDSFDSQGETTIFVDDRLPPDTPRMFYQIRLGTG